MASIGFDSYALRGSGMPDAPALYYQGTSRLNGGAGLLFGDGLRCVGGAIVRLGVHFNVQGESQYPSGPDTPISLRGGITSPGTRHYQVWYHDSAPYCTSATHNLSNACEVTWKP